MRDRDRLIFGGSQTDADRQERWSRRSGSPADSGSMLLQNVKVEQLSPAGKAGAPGGATLGGGRQAMRVLLWRGWKARGDES